MIALYASLNDPQTETLKNVLKEEGFTVLPLGEDQLSLSMSDILNNAEAGKEPALGKPFLYFYQEDHGRIFALQKKLNAIGLPQPAMAVYTENNASWKLEDLMKEVQREARYFERRDYLASLLQTVSRKEMKENPEFAQAVMMAFGLLKQDELPEDLLEMAIAFLEAAPKEDA